MPVHTWRRYLPLVVVGITLILLAALLYGAWRLDVSCEVIGRRIAMKQAGSVGCFEFWLNRYQTLIAGILAVAAAGVTVYVTRAQLREAQELTRLEILRYKEGQESTLGSLIYGFSMNQDFTHFRDSLYRLESNAKSCGYDYRRVRGDLKNMVGDFTRRLNYTVDSAGQRQWVEPLRQWVLDRIRFMEQTDLLVLEKAYEQYCDFAQQGIPVEEEKRELDMARASLLRTWDGLPQRLDEAADHLREERKVLLADIEALSRRH